MLYAGDTPQLAAGSIHLLQSVRYLVKRVEVDGSEISILSTFTHAQRCGILKLIIVGSFITFAVPDFWSGYFERRCL